MFQNNLQKNNANNRYIMNMNFVNSQKPVEKNKTNIVVTPEPIINQSETEKKEMKWAQPTWTMLHTLAEKVDNERFTEVREGLLRIIYMICTMLPCPICSEHAKEFLNGINFNTVVTKDNLRYLLFDFHNLVNSRREYKTFLFEDLIKYEQFNTNIVIQNCMFFFAQNSGSIRLIADDLHRKRSVVDIKKWFNENIKYFKV